VVLRKNRLLVLERKIEVILWEKQAGFGALKYRFTFQLAIYSNFLSPNVAFVNARPRPLRSKTNKMNKK